MGHAERTCLIGQRLADAVGLESAQRSSLFYALLLKDAGCSTTAAQIATTFGSDDQQVKRESRLIDAQPPAHGAGLPAAQRRPRRPAARARPPSARRGGDEPRRRRRARAHALRARRRHRARHRPRRGRRRPRSRQLFEHWDGNGHPGERAGRGDLAAGPHGLPVADDGGLLAAGRRGRRLRRRPRAARHLVRPRPRRRRGRARARRRFWASLETPDVQAVEPADRVAARRRRAPGPRRRGLRGHRRRQVALHRAPLRRAWPRSPTASRPRWASTTRPGGLLRRAALLHDLGKLGVSNRILDKPGALTDGEWARGAPPPAAVAGHPARRAGPRADVARLSATHHERLDGSGYPYGLTASELKLPDRILQVADVTDALTSERPYREALSPGEGAGDHALRRRQAPRRRRLRGRRVVAAPTATLARDRRRLTPTIPRTDESAALPQS